MAVTGGDATLGRYSFAPGLEVGIAGSGVVTRHFQAEYGPVAAEPAKEASALEVSFGRFDRRAHKGALIGGGHKTVRWEVALPDDPEPPVRVLISLHGAPRSFALSLVQGYIVEPMISLLAARRGYVLVPAAALRNGDGGVLIMGRSGSGKTSLSARALAAGRDVIGDDQVLLDGSGTMWRFPRRMRFYSDLPQTAPDAYRRLPGRHRRGLAVRRLLRRASRGYVAPPVRVEPGVLGVSSRRPVPLTAVCVIERDAARQGVSAEDMGHGAAARLAIDLLREQRHHLALIEARPWSNALVDTEEQERKTLSDCFRGRPCERVSVPAGWGARQSLDALAERLSLIEP